MNQDLQPWRMPRQLEQPHDPYDAEELENIMLLLQSRQQTVEIKRQRRHQIDHINWRRDEGQLAGTDKEPYDQLKREPSVADALDVEERFVRLRSLLLQNPGFSYRPIASYGLGIILVVPDGAVRRESIGFRELGAAVGDDHVIRGGVLDERDPHRGVGLEAEGQDGDDDEED